MQVMLPLDLQPTVKAAEGEHQSPGFAGFLAALRQTLAPDPEAGEPIPPHGTAEDEERPELEGLLLALVQLGGQNPPQPAQTGELADDGEVPELAAPALARELPKLVGNGELTLAEAEKLFRQDPQLFAEIVSALEKLAAAKKQGNAGEIRGLPRETPIEANELSGETLSSPETVSAANRDLPSAPQPLVEDELAEALLQALMERPAQETQGASRQGSEGKEPAIWAFLQETAEEQPSPVLVQQPNGELELSFLQPDEEGEPVVIRQPADVEARMPEAAPAEKRKAPEPQAGQGEAEGFFGQLAKDQEPMAVRAEKPQAPYRPQEFQAILSKAVVRIEEKVQELAVKIQPQSLGKVLLKVAMEEDGKMVAKFFAESSEAKGVLELNLPQLRETLAKEGLNLARCEVALVWNGEFGERERRERPPYPRANQIYHYEEQQLVETPTPVEQTGGVNYLV